MVDRDVDEKGLAWRYRWAVFLGPEHPDKFNSCEYLKPACQANKEMVAHKLVDMLNCDCKA